VYVTGIERGSRALSYIKVTNVNDVKGSLKCSWASAGTAFTWLQVGHVIEHFPRYGSVEQQLGLPIDGSPRLIGPNDQTIEE
jgi:hypothetical protein